MFTHVKSTIRHIIPETLNDRSLLKVVYVVLEPQYQSSLSAAVKNINNNNSKIAIEISGYLIEELRDPENYKQFQQDIEKANLFIASLIFIEDLADKVVEAVSPYREKLDAIVVFPSMPQVMRLNKLGSFSMNQLGQSKSMISQFMRKAAKFWNRFSGCDVKVITYITSSIKISSSRESPGRSKLYAKLPILARGILRKFREFSGYASS